MRSRGLVIGSREKEEREEEKNLQIAIRCLWDLFDYTANVYREIQGCCREIGLQGFRFYRDILGMSSALIITVVLKIIDTQCSSAVLV